MTVTQQKWAALEKAVKDKFNREPGIISWLRNEGDGNIAYRVFWKDDEQPSIVIVVAWDGTRIKWMKEAQPPRKGGNVLGETSVAPDDSVTRRLKQQLRESTPDLSEEQVESLFQEATRAGRRASEAGPTRSTNQAVRAAYASGQYTDKEGIEYRRGMDGWFSDLGDGDGVLLLRHDDFVSMIEEENP